MNKSSNATDPASLLLDSERVEGLIAERIGNLRTIIEELPARLDVIERAAKGEAVDREAVLAATHLILDNLYRGLLSPRPLVPKLFWVSPLGATIARAHSAVIRDDEVLSQAETAALLGVSREYVSHLVETGRVPTVVREASAPRSRLKPREMLYRSAVEALLRRSRNG